ncbi:hypothetical protein KCU70_g84, partial [Aureobasidium melanogenum]
MRGRSQVNCISIELWVKLAHCDSLAQEVHSGSYVTSVAPENQARFSLRSHDIMEILRGDAEFMLLSDHSGGETAIPALSVWGIAAEGRHEESRVPVCPDTNWTDGTRELMGDSSNSSRRQVPIAAFLFAAAFEFKDMSSPVLYRRHQHTDSDCRLMFTVHVLSRCGLTLQTDCPTPINIASLSATLYSLIISPGLTTFRPTLRLSVQRPIVVYRCWDRYDVPCLARFRRLLASKLRPLRRRQFLACCWHHSGSSNVRVPLFDFIASNFSVISLFIGHLLSIFSFLSDNPVDAGTGYAGPPLIFIPNKDKDDVIKGRCYISLTAATLVNPRSELNMDLGRLGGSAYCRLVEAYTYAQNQNKQKAFEEFGEVAELPDPDTWWAGKNPGPWKLRGMKMNAKVPVVVDKTTTVYKLE